MAQATSHALIMTISNYRPGIPTLAGVKYDRESALQIAHRLGVSDENILQLSDGQLTLAGMRAAFDNFIKQVGANDEVFIYYSGHGGRQYVKEPQERCAESLITEDGYGFTDVELSARLRELAAKTRRIIVFLDACHSGGVTSRAIHVAGKSRFTPKFWSKGEASSCGIPTNIIMQNLGQKTRSLGSGAQNYVYIAAARDDEVSLDEPGKGGLATQAWLKCMSGAASDLDGSGAITADEIRACAQQRINNEVEGDPYVKPHHVTIAGNGNAVLELKDTDTGSTAETGKTANPYKTLMDIYNSRDDRRVVTLKTDKPSLRIGQDKVEFTLASTHAGYVYLLMVGSDGKTFDLLFPNALDSGHYLEAGETLKLPAANWQITAAGPKGTDHLLALVSDAPRDFSGLGAKPAGPFSIVDANISAARDIQLVTSSTASSASKECNSAAQKNNPGMEKKCSDAYGAAILSLDEVEDDAAHNSMKH